MITLSQTDVWDLFGHSLRSDWRMVPVRLRHPKGVSTLQLPQDNATFTVQDFQQQIYSISEILPSRQAGESVQCILWRLWLYFIAVKTGYPPRSLTLIPELPFSSLGIIAGDQIIVSEIPRLDLTGGVAQDIETRPPQLPGSAEETKIAAIPLSSAFGKADFVETGDGSVLVHRVCFRWHPEFLLIHAIADSSRWQFLSVLCGSTDFRTKHCKCPGDAKKWASIMKTWGYHINLGLSRG